MEENRKCVYCKEIMTYGPQTQVCSTTIIKDGKRINHRETFIEYGWRCSMKKDDCDVVFDTKK
jgi:hypothetical protein